MRWGGGIGKVATEVRLALKHLSDKHPDVMGDKSKAGLQKLVEKYFD